MNSSDLSLQRRWWIVVLLSASIGINLVDRQVLSVVAPVLRQQLSLTNTQYSYIILAFQLGLLLAQVPAGVFLDVIGPRLGFIAIFVSWSVTNGLHALSRGVASLCGLRFLLGVSECGDYSGGIKVIAEMFPAENRAMAGGIFNGGAQLGAVIAPPLVVLITIHWGWRAAFLLPSALGLLWLLPWLALYPRSAAKNPNPAAARRAFNLRPGFLRAKKLLRNRQVLGVMLFRASTGPLTSFYWYWLPEYLRFGRGMPFVEIGLVAWMPYIAGAFGNVAGGYVSDFMIKRGTSVDGARKASFIFGAALSSLSLTLPFIGSMTLAITAICVIVLGNQWMVASYIGMMGDLFPSEIVATVNGLGGVADSGVGMVAMLLTGIVIDHFSYMPVLIAAGVLPVISVLAVVLVIRRIARVEMSFDAAL
ncbi:MAG TPA: MFS transporter [Terriglobia bacterium]|nr:MFS transporter [Terriglobia bacterium]